ncbi:hypothetical protein JCM6882_005333 [Rhodosporidiobolus microsporus]
MHLLLPALLALSGLLPLLPLAHTAAAPVALSRRWSRTSCEPELVEGAVYNVFQAGRAAQTWEFLPPAGKPQATTGGALYVSETDTPENGGFFVQKEDNGTYTLSLASRDEGVQCVRTVGKNRALTTGPCDLVKAQFTLSCSSCAAPSPSLSPEAGSFAARACVLTSLASPGYCIFSVPNADSPDEPGLANLEARKCAVRAARQSWDLVVS